MGSKGKGKIHRSPTSTYFLLCQPQGYPTTPQHLYWTAVRFFSTLLFKHWALLSQSLTENWRTFVFLKSLLLPYLVEISLLQARPFSVIHVAALPSTQTVLITTWFSCLDPEALGLPARIRDCLKTQPLFCFDFKDSLTLTRFGPILAQISLLSCVTISSSRIDLYCPEKSRSCQSFPPSLPVKSPQDEVRQGLGRLQWPAHGRLRDDGKMKPALPAP